MESWRSRTGVAEDQSALKFHFPGIIIQVPGERDADESSHGVRLPVMPHAR